MHIHIIHMHLLIFTGNLIFKLSQLAIETRTVSFLSIQNSKEHWKMEQMIISYELDSIQKQEIRLNIKTFVCN